MAAITGPWWEQVAAEHNIVTPESVDACAQEEGQQAYASLADPAVQANPMNPPQPEVGADTPHVIPVRLPRSTSVLNSVRAVFPATALVPGTEALLADLAVTTVSVTTEACEGTEAAAKSHLAAKSGEEPDFSTLNLRSDFEYALSAFGVTESEFTLDVNAFGLDSGGQVTLDSPNGIPDLAELQLVQYALQTPDPIVEGGISHALAVERWMNAQQSLALAQGYPSVDPRIMRVLYGYCVLGDTASVTLALVLGGLLGLVPVDDDAQASLFGPMPWPFSASGSAAGNGYCNSVQWTLAGDPATTPFDTIYTAYLYALVNKSDPSVSLFWVTISQRGIGLAPQIGTVQSPVGTPLTLLAVPKAPWVFDHWEVSGQNGTYLNPITVSDNRSVCAVFVPQPNANLSQDYPFRDLRMEQAVRVAANKLTGDLLWSDLLSLSGLNLKGLGITRLDGIEMLCNLTSIDATDNLISDITPLGGLSSLTQLRLGKNQISSLVPLAGLNNLTWLELGLGNALFDGLPDLSEQGNLITSFEALRPLESLQYLGLSGNQIDNTQITHYAGGTGYTDLGYSLLDAAYADSVVILSLDANPIGDLSSAGAELGPLPDMSNLLMLGLGGTGITNQSGSTFFASFPNLVGIDLSRNYDLETLNGIQNCAGMQVLLCSGNVGLNDVEALRSLNALNILYFAHTALTTEDLDALNQPVSGGADYNFQNGTLILKGNSDLENPCPVVETIASHNNSVDRDFGCGPNESTLRCAVIGEGDILPGQGLHAYPFGSVVQVQAIQTDPDYLFSYWSGSISGTDPTATVFMETYQSAMAVFVQGEGDCRLNMLEPQGAGTVTPAPGNWACRNGEQRRITAEPKPGWAFVHWVDGDGNEIQDGAAAPLPADAVLPPMVANRTVQAVFSPAEVMLRIVGTYGYGAGTVPAIGRHYYHLNDPVRLQAYSTLPTACFTGWSSTMPWVNAPFPNNTNPDLVLTMDQDYEIWGIFGDCTGQATLTMECAGKGLTVPAQGFHNYPVDTVVELSVDAAHPIPDWEFIQWEENGQAPSGSDPMQITLSANRTIRAVFGGPFCLDDFQRFLDEIPHVSGTSSEPGTYAIHLDQTPALVVETVANRLGGTQPGQSVPDISRLTMLAWLLQQPGDQPCETYLDNLRAWYAWVNLAANTAGLTYPTAEQLRTYAAYSSLSTAMNGLAVTQFLCSHVTPNSAAATALGTGGPSGLNPIAGLGLEDDLDGDGFANVDEWVYTRWYFGDFLQDLTGWEPGLGSFGTALMLWASMATSASSDLLPDFTTAGVGTGGTLPPTVQVDIAKDGDGSVSPPVGGYIVPKYRLSDWWPTPGSFDAPADGCAACQVLQMSASATPTVDSRFRYWRCAVGPIDSNMSESLQEDLLGTPTVDTSPEKTIQLVTGWGLTAVFRDRPGMDGMDLVSDVAELVEAAGEASQSAFRDLSYDTGRLQFDEDGNYLYTANGVPDAAEVALLEAVLQDDGYEQASSRGVSHEYVWRSYSGNLDLARNQMPGQDESAHCAVAALLTIGDLGHAFHARELVKSAYNVDMDVDEQKTGAFRWLSARNDANADGVTNAEVWAAASAGFLAGTATAEEAVGDFIAFAADRQEDGGAALAALIASQPSQGGAGDCGCWNDDCAGGGTLSVHSALVGTQVIGAAGHIESPAECPPGINVNVPWPGPSVQLGRKVQVSVTSGHDYFLGWSATGTPIDGCPDPTVSFIHGTGATVTPSAGCASIKIHHNSYVSVSVSGGGGGTPEQGSDYTTYSGLEPWSEVTLTASPSYTVTWEGVTATYYLSGWELSGTEDLAATDPSVNDTSPKVISSLVRGVKPLYTGASVTPIGMKKVTFKDTPSSSEGGWVATCSNLNPMTWILDVPEDETVTYHTASYWAYPYPGFCCSGVFSSPGQAGRYGGGGLVSSSTSGYADFEQMSKLTVNIECEGNDPAGGKSECVGSYTVNPATYYYDPALPAIGDSPASPGELVAVTANPRSGYRFVKWTGGGMEGATSNPITITMDKSKEITAVFAYPHPVSLSIHPGDTPPSDTGCAAGCQGFSMILFDNIEWKSSTGSLDHLLGGKVVEVLAYDPSVTSSEVEACAKNQYEAIMDGDPEEKICESGFPTSSIPVPWNRMMFGAVQTTKRFFAHAFEDAKKGKIVDDNHSANGTCSSMGCDSGTFTVKQFIVWLPSGCAYAEVIDTFDIKRIREAQAKTVVIEVGGVSSSWSCPYCPEGECPPPSGGE